MSRNCIACVTCLESLEIKMKSLQGKLIILLVMLSIVPIGIIEIINYTLNKNVLQKKIRESLSSTARIKQATLNSHLDNIVLQTKHLATGVDLLGFAHNLAQGNARGGNRNQAYTRLKEFQDINWGIFHHIMVADVNGNIVLSPWHKKPSSNHLGQNIRKSPFFKKALQSYQITDFFGFEEKDHYHQLIMYPIVDPKTSKTLAVIICEIEISYIQKLLQEGFSLGKTGKIYLSTLKSEPVVKFKKDFKGPNNHPGIKHAIKKGMALDEYINEVGQDVVGVYIKGRYPWVLVLEIEKSEVFKSIRMNLFSTLGIMIITSFVIFILIYLSSKKFLQPIKNMQSRFRELDQGDGDLTIRINTGNNLRELDSLGNLINSFIQKISDLVGKISMVAKGSSTLVNDLTQHSGTINDSAQNISSSVEESSAALEQLAASIDNVSSITDQNAKGMSTNNISLDQINKSLKNNDTDLQELSQLSRISVDKSRESKEAIKEVNSSMDSIRVLATQVNGILTIINEISEHTNLLSLNASIEAARAGEEGKGFAVVAQEISKLADKTASSVGSIQKLIEQTNQDLATGVSRVEMASNLQNEMVGNIQIVDMLSKKIAESISEQSQKIIKMSSDLTEMTNTSQLISDSTREQKSAASEINQSIQEITLSTSSFTNLSGELKKLAESMKMQSSELDLSLRNFKIN